MSKERGRWSLEIEGCNFSDLSEIDLEHIASCVSNGYTSGEICKEE